MRVGTLYAVLRLETGAFDAALAKSEGKMATFFGLIQAAAVLAASALVAVTAGALIAAASFEKHMANATAIMGDISEELMEKLTAAARQVAKETTFSANQAADAYYYLAAAGFTAEQAIALLPAVAKFAQASLIDMETATHHLAAIMTTFGLKTGDAVKDLENMTRVSDVLVKGAVDSLATMEDLSDSLVRVGGTARLFGLDLEDTVAVLMAFAQQGILGANAGTALSIVLRELSTKAIKNADDFAAFGIEVYDASGNMRDMADIIGDFERAMVGMSDEEKRNMLIKLGLTDRSNKFLLALLGTSDAIRAYEAALREAGGMTETVAQKQLNNFIAQLTIMWHKIVDVGITIGNLLLPHLTEVVKAIGNWFDANNELAGQITQKVIEAVRVFVLFLENRVWPVLERVARIIGNVIEQFRLWIFRLGEVTGAFSPMDKLFSAFTTGLYKVLDFFESDNGTIALAIGAIGLAIRGMATAMAAHPVIALILVLVTALGLLQQAWNTNAFGIQEKWAEFTEWFEKNAMPKIQEGFKWLDENVRPILEGAFKWFVEEALPALINGIKWLFEEALPALGQAISDFYEQNKEAFDRLAKFLTEDLGPDVADGLRGFGDWLIENGPTIASILGTLLELFGGLVTVMLTVASYVIPILWNGLMTILAPLGFLGEAVGILLKIVDESFKEIQRIVETVSFAISEAVRIAGEIWQGVMDEIQTRVDIFTGAWEEAKEIINGIWTEIQLWAETVGGIVQGIIDDIANAIYNVVRAVERAIQIINDFLGAKAKLGGGGANISNPFPKPTPTPAPSPTPAPAPSPYKDPTPISGFQQFAQGTVNFRGGLAIVGERGPELVDLPHGANVYSNDDMMRMLGGSNSGALVVNMGGVVLHTGNDVSSGQARRFAEMIHDELAATLQEQGARFPNKPRVGLT